MFSHATPFSCVARATIARGVCGIAVAASLSACLAGCGSLSLGGGNPSPDPGKGVEQPFKDPKKGMGGRELRRLWGDPNDRSRRRPSSA